MRQDRRKFLARAGVTAAGAALCPPQTSLGQTGPEAANRDCSGLAQEILEMFSDLPDRKALKVWSPATGSGPELLVEVNATQRMFAASTLKAVILCERLRQLDSSTVETRIA